VTGARVGPLARWAPRAPSGQRRPSGGARADRGAGGHPPGPACPAHRLPPSRRPLAAGHPAPSVC